MGSGEDIEKKTKAALAEGTCEEQLVDFGPACESLMSPPCEVERPSAVSTSARLRLLAFGAVIALSSLFQMGYSNAYVNTAIDSFRDFLNVSLSRRGVHMSDASYTWLWTVTLNVWFVGFAVGTWIAVPLTDRLGRARSLWIANVGTFVAVLVMAVAPVVHSPILLIVGRLGSSVASGVAMCSLILFLQECAPTEIRGLMSFYAELSFVVMNAVGSVAGMTVLLGRYLVPLIGLAAVPALFSVLVLIPFPESPKFLLLKRKNRIAASKSIAFYRGIQDGDAMDVALQQIAMEATSVEKVSIGEVLRTEHLRKALLLGVASLQLTVSVWPTIYFTTEFLRRANIPSDLAEQATSIGLVLSGVGTACGMVVVERFERRPLFLGCSATNVASLAVFVVCAALQPRIDAFKYGCIVGYFTYGISYSIATGPIAWFITAELSPQKYRSLLQSVALAANQLSALLLCFVTLPVYNVLNAYALVPLFIVPGCVCLVFLFFYLPETRGREIYEIVDQLKSSTSPQGKMQHCDENGDIKADSKRNENLQ